MPAALPAGTVVVAATFTVEGIANDVPMRGRRARVTSRLEGRLGHISAALQQPVLSQPEPPPRIVVGRETRELTLLDDELAPRIALLREPVRVHRSRSIER